MVNFWVTSVCVSSLLAYGHLLNKLHFDQQLPGSPRYQGHRRDIDQKESGNFNSWKHGSKRCTSCGLVGCTNRRDVHIRGRLPVVIKEHTCNALSHLAFSRENQGQIRRHPAMTQHLQLTSVQSKGLFSLGKSDRSRGRA